MKRNKRMLVILLSFLMVFTMCPMGVSADTGTSKWNDGLTIAFDDTCGGFATSEVAYAADGATITVTFDPDKLNLYSIDDDVNAAILAQNSTSGSKDSFYGKTSLTIADNTFSGYAKKDTESSWTSFNDVPAMNIAGDSSLSDHWPNIGWAQAKVGGTWKYLGQTSTSATTGTIQEKLKNVNVLNDEALVYGTNYRFVSLTGRTLYCKVYFMNGDNETIGEEQYKIVYTTKLNDIKSAGGLRAAISAAPNGSTITLGGNITLDTPLLFNGKTLTLDLNGKNITRSNASGATDPALIVTSGAILTIDDTSGAPGTISCNGTGGTHVGTAVNVNPGGAANSNDAFAVSTVTLKKGTLSGGYAGAYIYDDGKISVDGGTLAGYYYGVVTREQGATLEVKSGTVQGTCPESSGGSYGISGNGKNGAGGTSIEISGGTVSGASAGIYHPQAGTLDISGGTISGATALEVKSGTVNVDVTGGTFTATNSKPGRVANSNGTSTSGYAIALVENASYTGNATVTISAGAFTGPVAKLKDSENTSYTYSMSISGGYFTVSPDPAYMAAGKVAVTNTNGNGYGYTVADAAVEIVPAPPAVVVSDAIAALPPAEKEAVETALSGAAVIDSSGLTAAAGDVAAAPTANLPTVEAAEEELGALGISTAGGVSVVVQPYLEIEAVEYTSSTGVLALNITPMYKTVATTSPDSIDLDGSGPAGTTNAAVIGTSAAMTVTAPVEISIPLPSSFIVPSGGLQVKHVKANGDIYYYGTTITGSSTKTATFTVTHGFSAFTIEPSDTRSMHITFDYSGATSPVTYVATQAGVAFQTVSKSGYTFNGWSITSASGVHTALTGALWNDVMDGVTSNTAVNVTASAVFTKNSTGSGGGAASLSSTVTQGNAAADNGKVKVTGGSTAGSTVTVTVTPDTSFSVGKVTVTDAKGNAITLTDKGGNVFTYVMPATNADIKVTYAPIFGEKKTTPAFGSAVSSLQSLTVNGKAVDARFYNVDGYNYIKLRDIAALINGTGSQFSVGFNEGTSKVTIETAQAYVPVGGELGLGTDLSGTCVVSAWTITVNGADRYLNVYNIGGNNYFKLRELGELLGFTVDYIEASNTAAVTTK